MLWEALRNSRRFWKISEVWKEDMSGTETLWEVLGDSSDVMKVLWDTGCNNVPDQIFGCKRHNSGKSRGSQGDSKFRSVHQNPGKVKQRIVRVHSGRHLHFLTMAIQDLTHHLFQRQWLTCSVSLFAGRPYSLNLILYYFNLFPWLKHSLQGNLFDLDEEIRTVVKAWVLNQDERFLPQRHQEKLFCANRIV
jgi:hypothetical protein